MNYLPEDWIIGDRKYTVDPRNCKDLLFIQELCRLCGKDIDTDLDTQFNPFNRVWNIGTYMNSVSDVKLYLEWAKDNICNYEQVVTYFTIKVLLYEL